MANEVGDGRGRHLAHVLAHRLRDAEARRASTLMFHAMVRLVDVSGTTDSSYRRLDGLTRNRPLGLLRTSWLTGS